MNRRESLQIIGMGAAAAMLPGFACGRQVEKGPDFRYCLNTSTIQGQELGLKKNIEIAAKAGYDGLELWVRDVQAYIDDGNTLQSLDRYIRDHGLEVYNAIGFAPWLADNEEVAEAGFKQMEQEMEMMAAIGCTRIAAPAAGNFEEPALDLFAAGERFRRLIELGRKTGVMPQLEFWGASRLLYHIGQTLMIAAVANDPDVKILPDIYHLFRGGSGFESLKMLSGSLIDIFHINDYPGDVSREQQTDAHRVFPGEGVAPMQQIAADLRAMGGLKVLSLELFNRSYWADDALEVAETGLKKMKNII